MSMSFIMLVFRGSAVTRRSTHLLLEPAVTSVIDPVDSPNETPSLIVLALLLTLALSIILYVIAKMPKFSVKWKEVNRMAHTIRYLAEKRKSLQEFCAPEGIRAD